jgi:hypothetical protein
MKKITVLMLVLSLSVPVQGGASFPVRKKIVTVKETNYTAMAVACAITGVVVGAICIVIGYKLRDLKTSLDRDEIENRMIDLLNQKLNPFALTFRGGKCREIYGIFEDGRCWDIEPDPIKQAVREQRRGK